MSDAVADDGHRDKNWAPEGKEMASTSSASNVAQPDLHGQPQSSDNAGGDYRASSVGDNTGSGGKGDQPVYQKQPKVLGLSCLCL